MNLIRQIFLFAAVGTLGFIVDSTVLYALRPTAGLYLGRTVSFSCAVVVTWILNRFWTFGNRVSLRSATSEFFIYLLLMIAGGVVNYTVYAWLVTVNNTIRAEPVLGVAAGSLSGMGVNFLSARVLLFRKERGTA